MNFIIWLVVGGLIGWIASMIMRTDAQQGVILNVVVGIIGAMLGGWLLAPLFGTGTISGATQEGYGSLMELSADGQRQTGLASGETRSFLENGDEVIFRAHCRKAGFVPVGFGECRSQIT